MKKQTLMALVLAAVPLVSTAASGKKFLTLEDAAVSQAKKWQQTGVAKPIMSDDGKILYPFGQYLPTITCALCAPVTLSLNPATHYWKASARGLGEVDRFQSTIWSCRKTGYPCDGEADGYDARNQHDHHYQSPDLSRPAVLERE